MVLTFSAAIVVAAIVPTSRLPLGTSGAHIISTIDGERAHLSCVNWYGAHMDTFAVGGLQLLSLANSSSQ